MMLRTNNFPQKFASLAGIIALTLGLSACSVNSAVTAKSESELGVSPLTQYLNEVAFTNLTEEQRVREAEINRAANEIVAQCMKEAGFEYYYDEEPPQREIPERFPNDRDWVAQWGYGWASDAVAFDEWYQREIVSRETQQKIYWNSLSEAEQVAYGQVMSPPTFDENGNPGFGKPAGCDGLGAEYRMEHQVSGLFNTDEFAPLFSAINQFWADIRNNPELAPVEKDWSFCMADAGFPGYERQVDAQGNFINKTVNTFNNKWNRNPEGDRYSSPEFAELTELEINLALADHDCRESTDYQNRHDTITFELENRFMNDHKAELDAFKSAAEQRLS